MSTRCKACNNRLSEIKFRYIEEIDSTILEDMCHRCLSTIYEQTPPDDDLMVILEEFEHDSETTE